METQITKSEFFARIREKTLNFSPKNMALANFVVQNYQRVAFLTARQLAQECGVSESTVMRFVTALDYTGYPDFLRTLRGIVNYELTAVERLEITPQEKKRRRGRKRTERLARKTILTEIENLRRLYDQFSEEDFDRAVEEIVQAEDIVIVGFRVSASLAGYFGYVLKKVKESVIVVTRGGSTVYEELEQMGKTSLIIALGFRRYPAELIDLLRYCKTRGLRIFAITDSMISPVAALADVIQIVEFEGESFVDTFAAPMCLINGLIAETAMRDKKKSLSMLNRLERIADEKKVYFQETNRET
ncbi:MAG: SIS domain-containing protein [Proteobacteria bacterium]|nr:SIS domain-containing protein [Pseudomonadota bacterium]